MTLKLQHKSKRNQNNNQSGNMDIKWRRKNLIKHGIREDKGAEERPESRRWRKY